MATIERQYNYFLNELSDPRVKDWPLMESPGPILTILAFYLMSIYVFLPAYMENRKPFKLKTVIFYYNIFQIVACSYLIYGIATSGWTTEYSLSCQPVDYSQRPIAMRMLTMVYWTFILKIIELIETVFFVLRKKHNQVSKLHVYHHTSTAGLAWVGTKFIGGGQYTLAIILNSFIHVLMYTYYLLSSLGPDWQKRLEKWKPRLTMAQLIQFGLLLIHSGQSLMPGCKASSYILLFYVPNVVLIATMFWNFYKTTYLKKSKSK